MRVLWIDPGKNWGMALVEWDEIVSLHSIPTMANPFSNKPKRIIDEESLMDTVVSLDYDLVYIEKVIGRGGWWANSNFSFWYTCGFLSGALACEWTRSMLVTPQQWHKMCWEEGDIVYENPHAKRRKKDTKQTSLNAAKRIFNVDDDVFLATARSKKPHDGLYEAALIAYYWYLSMWGDK